MNATLKRIVLITIAFAVLAAQFVPAAFAGDEAEHRQLVYSMAWAAGFSPQDAHRIASASWSVDSSNNQSTEPFALSSAQRAVFHELASPQQREVIGKIWQGVVHSVEKQNDKEKDLIVTGISLHPRVDSFVHPTKSFHVSTDIDHATGKYREGYVNAAVDIFPVLRNVYERHHSEDQKNETQERNAKLGLNNVEGLRNFSSNVVVKSLDDAYRSVADANREANQSTRPFSFEGDRPKEVNHNQLVDGNLKANVDRFLEQKGVADTFQVPTYNPTRDEIGLQRKDGRLIITPPEGNRFEVKDPVRVFEDYYPGDSSTRPFSYERDRSKTTNQLVDGNGDPSQFKAGQSGAKPPAGVRIHIDDEILAKVLTSETPQATAKLLNRLETDLSRAGDYAGQIQVLEKFATAIKGRYKTLRDGKQLDNLISVSLKEVVTRAEKFAQRWNSLPGELQTPGPISRIHGFVIAGDDILVVGRRESGAPLLQIDDLIVGIRAAWKENATPLVSLDPDPDNFNENHKVRIEGIPKDSGFALTMLEADYAMKKIMMGLEPVKVPGYRTLVQTLNDTKDKRDFTSRFWLYPIQPGAGDIQVSSDTSSAIFLGGVQVLSEEMIMLKEGLMGTGQTFLPAEEAARSFTLNYEAIAAQKPAFQRLQGLFDVILLGRIWHVRGLESPLLDRLCALPHRAVEIPRSYPAVSVVLGQDGDLVYHLYGGAQAEVGAGRRSWLSLEDDDLVALHKACVRSSDTGAVSGRLGDVSLRAAAPSKRPNASSLQYTTAVRSLYRGDLKGALDASNQLVASNPRDSKALVLRALIHLHGADYGLGRRDADWARVADPGNRETAAAAAEILFRCRWLQGDPDGAFDELKATLKYKPKFFSEETLALKKAKLGPDHPETLHSMDNLAFMYSGLGRNQEALKLHEEALALRKSKLGPDHPHTLFSMTSLAVNYSALGRHTDALKLNEETLALQKAKLGPDHTDTLKSMPLLAINYSALGRHADAVNLSEETVALYKAKLGSDHPDTLRCMNLLAINYAALGRHADALKLNEGTLALQKAKLGPDHTDTLRSMSFLAGNYSTLGRHADALKLNEETLALTKAKLGPDHQLTLLSMTGLALNYAALGRHADALKLNEETLALQKAKLGSDDTNTIFSMTLLALDYYNLGRHADAVKLWEEILPLEKAKFGPDHPDTLRSMNLLASSYASLGRDAEALKLYEEALALRKAKLGPDHADTLRNMSDLANMLRYANLGRDAEALKLNEETLALRKTKLGPDHPDTLASMGDLAYNYLDLGRDAEALKLYEEALALRKAKLGPDHADTLRNMSDLANSYANLGRDAEALKLHEETLALQKAKLGPDHTDTLASMGDLATSYFNLGRDAEALKLHEETLALRKAKLGSDHPATLLSMDNLALMYSGLSRNQEGLKLREETLALRKAKLGPDHPDTLRNMSDLANSYAYLGRDADAIKVHEETLRLAPKNADAHIVLGSILANCPEVKLRDPRKALQHAREAIELASQSYGPWLVLGWASYRTGAWKDSIQALEKSISLQASPKGGNSWQWFFLAMAHRQLGHKDEARKWYDQAVQWMDKNQPNNEELRRLRAEAAGPGQPVPEPDKTALEQEWAGHFTQPGAAFDAKLRLRVLPDGAVEGSIHWTFTKSDREESNRNVGRSGTEFVWGAYDPKTRLLLIDGYRRDDPHAILGLDRYRLTLGAKNQTLGGTTWAGGSNEGRLDLTPTKAD